MKVWIVYDYDGGAHYVEGVFSSEEKAKEYIKYHGGSEFRAEKYEVDEPFSKDESYWEVTMRMSKRPSANLVKCEKDLLNGTRVETFSLYKFNSGEVNIYVKSKTMDDVSFPDFSRRFSVSLANSIDTFWEVLLKRFTLLMDKPDSGFLFGKNGCPRWSIHSYIYIPC